MKIDASSLMAMRSAILQQNSALQKVAAPDVSTTTGTTTATGAVGGADFGKAMTSALSQVNSMQDKAATAADSYDRGTTTDIAGVMLAREQASVGFQATLQVRNKLLSAYKDIMSMPV